MNIHFVYKVFFNCKLCCNKYPIHMPLSVSALYSRAGVTKPKDTVYFNIRCKIALHK